MRRKHIPQRTCVACRQVRSKRDLLRIVRTPVGDVELDETGKKAGRGAYVCRSAGCVRKAVSSGALNHALKTTLTPEQQTALRDSAGDLPEEITVGQKESTPSGR